MILDRTISLEPKAWKESVQEADIMLGELLAKLGYQGQNTHERLRAVQEGAFVTLPNAWEAHRIRNFISAPSSDYILTQREAFRVLKLYEQVFEEFDFI
jgi:carboxylesterase type B